MNINCCCQNIEYNERCCISVIGKLRKECEILKLVFPEDVWDETRIRSRALVWAECDNEKSRQQSVFLIAYARGMLHLLMRPFHHFLARNKFTNQYVMDLRENWILGSTERDPNVDPELDLHQRYKEYAGKINEIVFAYFLEKNGFKIINLAAWDKDAPDIVAGMTDTVYHIECKFVGEVYSMFAARSESEAISYNPYSISEYLQDLIEVANAQLNRQERCSPAQKVVVIILDPMNESSFLEGVFDRLKIDQLANPVLVYLWKYPDSYKLVHTSMEKHGFPRGI